MKKIIIPFLILVFVVTGALLFDGPREIEKNEKISVVASFYPLFDMASKIGGTRTTVVNLTPPGTDPHEYEPSPRDLAKIENADLFLYNGAGLDPWAEKKKENLIEQKADVMVLDMSSYSTLLENTGDHHQTHHHEKDPHFWLSPLMMKNISEAILGKLIKADPEGEEYYTKNTEEIISLLENLHKKYETGLSRCKLDSVVISHASLGYLAKQYNFNMIAISGISPLEEPSPKKLAEITNLVNEKEIGHIFFETTIPSGLAQTIADETKAETLLFNPVASLTEKDIETGENYFSVMKSNLANLKTALKCD